MFAFILQTLSKAQLFRQLNQTEDDKLIPRLCLEEHPNLHCTCVCTLFVQIYSSLHDCKSSGKLD